MPEPNGAPPKESGGFLMKKFGPLPIAAYVVAGAALIGFMVFRNKGTKTTGASTIQAAPTGIQDPTTDQNAQLFTTLNDLSTSVAGLGTQIAAMGTVVPAPTATPTAPSGTWGFGDPYSTYTKGQPIWWRWTPAYATTTNRDSLPIYGNPPPSAPNQSWQFLTPTAKGGGEAPERILPDYMLRPPVHLDTAMTQRPPVLIQPR